MKNSAKAKAEAKTKHYNKLREMAEARDAQDPNKKLFEGITKMTAFMLDPRLIKVEPGFNARPLDEEHVEEFVVSIIAGGYIPPMAVKVIDGEPTVRDGHHRLEAYMRAIAKGADIKSVQVVEFTGNDADAVALLVTSAGGMPLTPLQRGVQYKKLVKFGWTNQQIAEVSGKSVQHVTDMLLLANSNNDVQQLVSSGQVAAHVALKTVRNEGAGAGKKLKEQLAKAQSGGARKLTNKTAKAAADASTPASEKPAGDPVTQYLYEVMRDAGTGANLRCAAITLHNLRIGNTGDMHAVEPVGTTLQEAIKIEMETEGQVMAETLCPEFAELIVYLRTAARANA